MYVYYNYSLIKMYKRLNYSLNTKAKSLNTFITKDYKAYNYKGIRFSMKNYIDQGWMINLPLYAVSCI